MGRNEPFWRTNSSFSPPLSRRWDYRFHSEGLLYGSQGDGGSSLSSNSKESRSWGRAEHPPDHNYSASDGAISYFSSPSDSFPNQQLTPPRMQGVNIDEYVRGPSSEPLVFSQFVEGTSGLPYGAGSTSSRSDGSEYEPTSKSHAFALCNFSSHRSFMSKPIHPLSYPDDSGEEEAHGSHATSNANPYLCSNVRSIQALTELRLPGFLESGDNPPRNSIQSSSPSSIDFADISEQLELECSGPSISRYEGVKCGLCERLLSQRSPWGSRRIVRSGDMPIASVLSCWHVYHAECLEHITPKTHKNDPPCPLCEKSEENTQEQWAVRKLKNGLPRLRSPGDEGPSKIWGRAQVGDCVEGALHAPRRSGRTLSRSYLKRHLSLKGNWGKEQADSSKKSGFCSPEVFRGQMLGDQGAVGCSKMTSDPAFKRW